MMAYIDQDDYRQSEYADLYRAFDILETMLRGSPDSILDAEIVLEDILDAEEVG